MRSLIRHPYERAAIKAAKKLPRDPAPSKWKYRYQRWMLTPGVRAGLRIGTPLALIAIIVGVWVAKDENRAWVSREIAAMKEAVQQRPEFTLTRMTIVGADSQTMADVQTMLPVAFPVSSFDLDLTEMKATVEDLYAVESAQVRATGGALKIDITPRVPVAVWRDKTTLRLIDAGQVISGIIETRADRRDLPLIAGDGAYAHLEEALALFQTAAPIKERVRGLVRMGERRWDVVLDRGQRILLPEYGALRALERTIALDVAQDLLARDVAKVDLRLEGRPTVQMTQAARDAWLEIRAHGQGQD